jgi:plastocyanin
LALIAPAAIAAILLLPAGASANTTTCSDPVGTVRECVMTVGPVGVDGFEAVQAQTFAPHPTIPGPAGSTEYVTHMSADLVDNNGDPVPISRMMLHHLVFANLGKPDYTCHDQGFTDFAESPSVFSGNNFQRFYAAGEEHGQMYMPDGYGYPLKDNDNWGVLYMVMNHKSVEDEAYIRYRVTLDSDQTTQPVKPYWLDVRDCRADPVYTTKGDGGPDSSDVQTADYTFPQSGRIVSGGGHTHGGARELDLTKPNCQGNDQLATSVPTWGLPDHPYYTVRPILHEPGPASMSEFTTEQGIPVNAGETLRLSSIYDNSQVHHRVMGISIVYFAPDSGVTANCEGLPTDTVHLNSDDSVAGANGRAGPIVPYKIPLYKRVGDEAVKVKHPPGDPVKVKSGKTITANHESFSLHNIVLKKGGTLNWDFQDIQLHNITVVSGPDGFASPNLDPVESPFTTYSHKFKKPGTYNLFCALHPVAMNEQIKIKR